jgi:hypothetical protein
MSQRHPAVLNELLRSCRCPANNKSTHTRHLTKHHHPVVTIPLLVVKQRDAAHHAQQTTGTPWYQLLTKFLHHCHPAVPTIDKPLPFKRTDANPPPNRGCPIVSTVYKLTPSYRPEELLLLHRISCQ